MLWADTWRVANPVITTDWEEPPDHPFALSIEDLEAWLQERDLVPSSHEPATAILTPAQPSAGAEGAPPQNVGQR